MKTEILLSGFGGQGMLSLGKFIARLVLAEGKHTTWFPSYGAEVRGGTAHCFVKVSDRSIGSPFICSSRKNFTDYFIIQAMHSFKILKSMIFCYLF